MDFNGTDEHLNLGIASSPESTDFSITAWVNVDTVAAGADAHAIVHLGDNTTPYDGTSLYIKRGTNGGRVGVYDPNGGGGGGLDFSANVAVTANEWGFVGVRGTKAVSGTVDVSVNGGLWTNLITGDTTGLAVGTDSPHSIGVEQRDGAFNNYTNGTIADVRLYNRQLDVVQYSGAPVPAAGAFVNFEIDTMYQGKGTDGIIAGLVGRYPLQYDTTVGTTPQPHALRLPVSRVEAVSDSNLDDGTQADITITTTALTLEGDLLIAVISLGGPSGFSAGGTTMSSTSPSDWHHIFDGLISTGFSTPRVYVYIRAANATDAGGRAYTFTAVTNNPMVGQIIVYRNIPSNYGIISAINNLTLGNDAVSPAMTYTGNTALILRIAVVDGNMSAQPVPLSYTGTGTQVAIAYVGQIPTVDPNGSSLGVAEQLDVADSVGTATWTHTNDESGSLTLVFRTNICPDIAGIQSYFHHAQAVGTPTVAETEIHPR